MVFKCVAGDFPEQQPGEGKCPLTNYVLLTYNSLVTPQCHLGFLSNAKPRTIISCEPK
jgi:hypothetical protein